MAKLTLTDITAGYTLTTTANANNALIEAALENTLSRDGTTPNTMGANLDMNSNKIVNLTDGANNQDAVTVAQLNAASVVANTTTAALTTVADSGNNFTGTTVEGVLAEIATGEFLWPQTAGESAASVTPTNYSYEPGDVRRYGAVGDGTTDDGTALRNAHAANKNGRVIYQGNTYYTTISIPFYSESEYRGVTGKTKIYTDQNIPICVSANYLSSLGESPAGDLDIYGIEALGDNSTLTTGTAQAGASGTITLAAGASASDDTYNNMFIQITGGVGDGQVRWITDYDGTTKVATLDSNWTTTPDATSTYRISAQVGFLIRDYYVNLDELIARNCGGGGVALLIHNDAAAAIGGTLVEGRIGKIAARDCGGALFYFGGNGNAKITDWEVEHLLGEADSSTGVGLFLGQGSGWRITRVHTYGTALAEAIEIVAPFKTQVTAYVEGYTTTGIRVSSLQEGLILDAMMDAASAAASSNAIRVSRSGAEANAPCLINATIDMESNSNSCNGLNIVNSGVRCFGSVLVGGANAANMTPVVTSSGSTTHVATHAGLLTRGTNTFTAADATPSVADGKVFLTDTGGLTITDFDDGVAGQEITVISKGAVVFDTTGTNLVGSTVDLTTASGDITRWVCEDGTTWRLLAFVDVSVDNSGGA